MTSEGDNQQQQSLIELRDDGLEALIDSIDILPSPPQTVLDLNEELRVDEPSVSRIIEIVEADPAMTAKLLGVVNSAYFGLSHRIISVHHAVTFLGLEAVRNMLSAVELLRAFSSPRADLSAAMEQVHSHSWTVANTARSLTENSLHRQQAFAAGMLHDVGMLVVLASLPEKFNALCEARRTDDDASSEIEIIGASHASIGAFLLQLWGLPDAIIEAVLYSHGPIDKLSEHATSAHAVFVAEQLVNVVDQSKSPWEFGRLPSHEYLELVGMSEPAASALTASI